MNLRKWLYGVLVYFVDASLDIAGRVGEFVRHLF